MPVIGMQGFRPPACTPAYLLTDIRTYKNGFGAPVSEKNRIFAFCNIGTFQRNIMKIALIGYGKMGHAIEAMAARRGHTVACIVDRGAESGEWRVVSGEWKAEEIDVAIEFTTPATAVANIRRCWAAGLPVVCGTTGWDAERAAVEAECRQGGHTLLASSNFSIGMNIMFALNERLAELMRGRTDYSCSITETHHVHKLDAPSGTALTLQRQIVERGQREAESIPIESIREGEVPGTHTVVYDSKIDTLTLTHEAHSREGLALGALLAAEYVAGKKGVFTMKDML